MDFCSTRNAALRTSAARAILQGLAEDGGQFVPCQLPRLSEPEIMMMAAMNYQKTAETVLKAFLPGFPGDALHEAVAAACNGCFDVPSSMPLRKLRSDAYLLELWHGPSSLQSDFPMRLLSQLLPISARLEEQSLPVCVLCPTTGSMGLSACLAFAQQKDVRLSVLYPENVPAKMQQSALCACDGENVQVLPVQGDFAAVQEVSAKLLSLNPLTAADSRNWAYLAAQAVPYFWAYAQLLKTGEFEMGQKISFSIPSGSLGSLTAGLLAKKAGLPIDKLLCASGSYHAITDFLSTGTLLTRNRTFAPSCAPGLDVMFPTQLERLLYVLFPEGEQISNWMQELAQKGQFSIGTQRLKQLREEGIKGFRCDDEQMTQTIRELWFCDGVLCDPHTGAAVHALRQLTPEDGDAPCVVLHTASPFYFASAMLPAMDLDFQGDDFQQLEVMEIVGGRAAPALLKALKNAPVQEISPINADVAAARVLSQLGISPNKEA